MPLLERKQYAENDHQALAAEQEILIIMASLASRLRDNFNRPAWEDECEPFTTTIPYSRSTEGGGEGDRA